jgi:hypothetical protein
MSDGINLEKHQREVARWLILRVLDAGRPAGVNAAVTLKVLQDDQHDFTMEALRRELSYLHTLGLVETNDAFDYGKLTAEGVAVIEYNAPSPAGIARPKQSRGVE